MMSSPRKPVRTVDGLVHLETRHLALLLCGRPDQLPDFVYMPADAVVTCLHCLWYANFLDSPSGKSLDFRLVVEEGALRVDV